MRDGHCPATYDEAHEVRTASSGGRLRRVPARGADNQLRKLWTTYSKASLVVRRRRKTLEIAVEPDASVVVTAPLDAPVEAIVEKVRKRAAWVRRQQHFFSQFLPRTPPRRYVAGETHLYLGRQYRLKVVRDVRPGVQMIRGFIIVQTREPDQPEVTRRLVETWYRKRARAKFAERLEATLARFPNPEAFRPEVLGRAADGEAVRITVPRRAPAAQPPPHRGPGRHDRLRDRARALPHGGAQSRRGVPPVAGPGHAGLGGQEGAVGGADGLRR